MRILVLTIFLTLLNDVRAAPTQECLDSFSVDMSSSPAVAEEICDDFSTANILDCGRQYPGLNLGSDEEDYDYKFIRIGEGVNIPSIVLEDTYGDGWEWNKLQYLSSSGALEEITQSSLVNSPQTFDDNLQFAVYTYSGNKYIVSRYDGSSGSHHYENLYTFNCECEDAERNFNPTDLCDSPVGRVEDELGNFVCDTASGFVESSVCYNTAFIHEAHCNARGDGRQVRMYEIDGADPATPQRCFALCVANNEVRLNARVSANDPDYWGPAQSFHWKSNRCYCNANPCDDSYCDTQEDGDAHYGICNDQDDTNDPQWYTGSTAYEAYAISYNNCFSDSTQIDITGTCECDDDNKFPIDGSCQECPAGWADGNGGCQFNCPSGTVPNNDNDRCICDTSQSLYGIPSQCETRVDDCTQLHNNQYPMLMKLDGVCLPLTRNIVGSACSDTTTDHGTNCIYEGPDIATGFENTHIVDAFLMEDPPQHTFTVTSDANTDLHVRLFYHNYRFTCVNPTTNCFQWYMMQSGSSQDAFYNQEGGVLDLSGGIEGGTVKPSTFSQFIFNQADYYNIIRVKIGSTLKIEKLDNCAENSASPLSINADFCECICQESAPHNGETGYSCQGVDSVLNSQLCYTDSNGQIQQMPIQEVQAIQTSISAIATATNNCPLN